MFFSADPPNAILHIIIKLEHASGPWISVDFGSCKQERIQPKLMSLCHRPFFFFFESVEIQNVNVQNYLAYHTSDVRNRKLEALFYPMTTTFQNFALPFPKPPFFVYPTKISHRIFHVNLTLHRCSSATIVSAADVISRVIKIFNGRSGLIKDVFVVDIFTK
jgi:hypothetical protein